MTRKINESLVRQFLADGRSMRDIARQLGVNESSVRRCIHKNGLTDGPRPIVPAVDDVAVLRAQVKELEQHTNKQHKADVATERALRAIEAAVQTVKPKPRPPKQFDRVPSSAPRHRQAVILSDWHGGEVVYSDQMNGLNAYDLTIMGQRVDELYDGLLSFKRHRPALTGLDLWVLGDMVSGDIHEELTATNAVPIAEQAVHVGYELADLISRLAPEYEDLRVSCVPGNHGRAKKDHASKNVHDSWDWVAFQIMKAAVSSLDNVTVDAGVNGQKIVQIAGLNYLLWHGDGVRSSMPGVPWGGVVRRVNELSKTYQHVRLDGFALGHFHQPNIVDRRIFVNGSLVGANEYGLKNFGSSSPPCQLLLTFDEKRNRLTDVNFLTPTSGVGS